MVAKVGDVFQTQQTNGLLVSYDIGHQKAFGFGVQYQTYRTIDDPT